MKKAVIVFIVFLLAGCHHNQSQAFNNLTSAFFQWYYKSNPTVATRLGQIEFARSFEKFDTDFLKENLSDLKRFDLELTQIDRASLSDDRQVDYSILSNAIESLIYDKTEIQEYNWNTFLYQKLISQGTKHLLYSNIPENQKSIILVEKLSLIPQLLIQAELRISETTSEHKKLAVELLNSNILLIQDLPLHLTADNTTLDALDVQIGKTVNALRRHEAWLNDIDDSRDYRIGRQQFKDRLDLITGNRYLLENSISDAQMDISFLQNEMFMVAYPFYLQENDEPVWVSRQDTIDVVKWGVEKIFAKPATEDYLADDTISSMEEISRYIDYQQLFTINQLPELTVTPQEDIINSFMQGSLNSYGTTASTYHADYQISTAPGFTDNASIIDFLKDYNQYSLVILNMIQVLPAELFHYGALGEDFSNIRQTFPDPLIQSGWAWYGVQVMIDNGFGIADFRYKLEYLRHKLGQVTAASLQYEMHTSDVQEDILHQQLVQQAFKSPHEASRFIEYMKIDPFYFVKAYLGESELNYLQNQANSQQMEKFVMKNYHQSLFQEGIISYPDLQFLILE